MAKEQPVRTRNWTLWTRVALWAFVFVSTAMAARSVSRLVLDDPRFLLKGSLDDYERSPGFKVEGVRYTSRDRVAKVFERDFGRNVFLISTAERRRRLLAIDWIADASVARIWPDRIVVRIREREPVAFVQLSRDGASRTPRLALIDAEGVILGRPEFSPFSFPVLTGVFERETEPVRRAKVQQYQRLITDVGPLGKDISEVDVSSPDIHLTLNAPGRAVDLLLGTRNFNKRIRNFLKYYPEIRKRQPNVVSFDLRLDGRITARE